MRSFLSKVGTITKQGLLVALLLGLYSVMGLSLGVALHLQFLFDALVVSALATKLLGTYVPWVPLVLAFDIALILGIVGLIGWLLTKRDAQLIRLTRNWVRRLVGLSPQLAPDDSPKMLTGLGLLMAVGLLSATIVIFGASILTWDQAYGGLFDRPHTPLEACLYVVDHVLKGTLYPFIESFGISGTSLRVQNPFFAYYALAYQWLLWGIAVTFLWRTFMHLYRERGALFEIPPGPRTMSID